MQVSVEGKMVEVSDGASCADALKEGLSGKRFKAAIACKAGDTLLDLTAPVPTTTETLTLTPVTARHPPKGAGALIAIPPRTSWPRPSRSSSPPPR